MLPDELENRVQSELRSGERLVWTGQPKPGRFMRGSIPIVLFGIPWTAFSIFWIAMTSGIIFGVAGGGNAPGGFGGLVACFPLFGLPFVLIGIGMLTSPFWMYRRALRTCYALSDQRAIVWATPWFRATEVRSYTAAELGKMTRREYGDGTGDLVFEEFVTVTPNSNGGYRSQRTERGFLGIGNVREVEELVQRTLLGPK
jgi:hypothetical protein